MKLKNYFKELVKTMQVVKVTYNQKNIASDNTYIQGCTIRTSLRGQVIDKELLKGLEDRIIHTIGAVDNDIHIYLKDEENE